MEKAKSERRKEKRREKKEKRRERKEKKDNERSVLSLTEIAREEYGHKGKTSKRKLEDADPLEKSSVTEEHGNPLTSQNPSNSSDSTQNSNKRRRQALPPCDVEESCGLGESLSVMSVGVVPHDAKKSLLSSSPIDQPGNIIRIRMPIQIQKEPATVVSKERVSFPSIMKEQHKESDLSASKVQICSTSGTKVFPGQGHDIYRKATQEGICSVLGRANIPRANSFVRGKELSCSASGSECHSQDDRLTESGFSSGIMSHERKMQKINRYTETLFKNLVPLGPREISSTDDNEWLFEKKQRLEGSEEKKFRASNDVSCCGSSVMRPHAQYLAKAEIYALPYVVPF